MKKTQIFPNKHIKLSALRDQNMIFFPAIFAFGRQRQPDNNSHGLTFCPHLHDTPSPKVQKLPLKSKNMAIGGIKQM
jgi:hypothetical protein